MILRDRDRTVDPCCDNVVGLVFGDHQPSFSSSVSSISTIMAEAHQRDVRDDQDRQRTVRQETTKSKAGTLPLNMYQTAVHRGERLEFAPV